MGAVKCAEDNCVLNTYRTTLSWKATGRLHHMSAYQVKSSVRRATLAERRRA